MLFKNDVLLRKEMVMLRTIKFMVSLTWSYRPKPLELLKIQKVSPGPFFWNCLSRIIFLPQTHVYVFLPPL
jgi:hypothetical protein